MEEQALRRKKENIKRLNSLPNAYEKHVVSIVNNPSRFLDSPMKRRSHRQRAVSARLISSLRGSAASSAHAKQTTEKAKEITHITSERFWKSVEGVYRRLLPKLSELVDGFTPDEIARELTLKDEWKVGRVIARPYVGKKKGEFVRTANRHDYALKPSGKTALNVLKDAGLDVISVGKIYDIFDGEGLTESNKSKSSVHGMEQTIAIAQKDFTGLCYVNLVDFDAQWGHRRDPEGYAKELEQFDEKLGELLKYMKEDDLLIITADHGNDPTYKGTDHTREKVLFLAYSPSMKGGGRLEDSDTFASVGATIVENFGLSMPEGTIGGSVLGALI